MIGLDLKSGDVVEWVKPNESYRDWYGTVHQVGETHALVEWIVRPNRTKLKWEPFKDLIWLPELPAIEDTSFARKTTVAGNIDFPYAYTDWHMDGNCYANGSTDFVGYSTLRPSAKMRKRLEQACDGCPVMLICRGEAVRTASVGWWGGMDEPSRNMWANKLPKKDEDEVVE